MVDRVWDIAQTRYGARCMRTCLEREETSHYHKVSNAVRAVRARRLIRLHFIETHRYCHHLACGPPRDESERRPVVDLVDGRS
jgi:hypothetical protein